jgi:hypothetical protein
MKLYTFVVHYLQMCMKEYSCCPKWKRGMYLVSTTPTKRLIESRLSPSDYKLFFCNNVCFFSNSYVAYILMLYKQVQYECLWSNTGKSYSAQASCRTQWEIHIKTILSGTSSSIKTKLWCNSHWMVLFQNGVRQLRSPAKMAATVQLQATVLKHHGFLFITGNR